MTLTPPRPKYLILVHTDDEFDDDDPFGASLVPAEDDAELAKLEESFPEDDVLCVYVWDPAARDGKGAYVCDDEEEEGEEGGDVEPEAEE
jgi:hypothetical protein